MARMKNTTPSGPQFCGDCALATPSDYIGNLDQQGKPICYRCPHSERARIRSEVACKHGVKRTTAQ